MLNFQAVHLLLMSLVLGVTLVAVLIPFFGSLMVHGTGE
jgi:hypothetical protein